MGTFTTRIDLVGRRFGRLTVISFAETRAKRAFWLCQCKCGTEKIISGDCLRQSLVKSCGCLRRETTAKKNFRHGLNLRGNRNRHYTVWVSMMARCYTPTCKDYRNYGKRGIVVCDEWHEPSIFVNWCLSKEPIPTGHSIDRIEVNGPYSPSNCQFASALIQGQNKRPPNEWSPK
jgi:hypothetical protein